MWSPYTRDTRLNWKSYTGGELALEFVDFHAKYVQKVDPYTRGNLHALHERLVQEVCISLSLHESQHLLDGGISSNGA